MSDAIAQQDHANTPPLPPTPRSYMSSQAPTRSDPAVTAHSNPAQQSSGLLNLPPELFATVTRHTPEDWFSLRLTCKAMEHYLPGRLQDHLLAQYKQEDKDQKNSNQNDNRSAEGLSCVTETPDISVRLPWKVNQTLYAYEIQKEPERKSLTRLVCIHCNQSRPRELFTDAEAGKKKESITKRDPWTPALVPMYGCQRCCIPCGVRKFEYF